MSKSELYDLLAYLGLEQYEKVVAEIEKKDKEIQRLKEDYMILQNASDEVEEEKDREIERLTYESTKWESKFYDEAKKVDKAIECIYDELLVFGDETQWEDWEVRKYVFKVLDILKGSDKSE